MVICELCGSANNELDESCRVCGQALKAESATQTPVAAAAVPPAPPAWPGLSNQDISQQLPPDLPPAGLQMSAVKQAPQTGVPPMISARQELESVSAEPDTSTVPGFMSTPRSSNLHHESVELISGNDLPDWIKQIAAADEAKAAAEAEAAHEEAADPTASIVRRPLPGETHVGGPSTTWLSKSGNAPESGEHWGASEVASVNWGGSEPGGHEAYAQHDHMAAAAPVFVPSPAESYSYPKAKKRFSLPGTSPSSTSSSQPIYRRQSIQIVAILVVVAILALMML